MKRSVRTLPALVIAAGLLVTLAACAPPVTNLAGCVSPFAAGDNSNAVTASGRVGSAPRVDFPTPLVAKDGQVSVLERGDGPVAYPGSTVEYFITVFDSETGEESGTSGYGDDAVLRRVVGNGDAVARILTCVPAGSRVSFVGTTASLAEEPTEEQLAAEGTLVAVVDVVEVYLGKANGWDQFPQAGMPSVVRAPNGEPGLIVPNEDPPAELRIALLKAGAGDVVEEGDSVIVQYTGMVWGNDTPFDSSWSGTPERPPAPALLNLDDVVPGFAQALIGQKVGSQVLAVIPPDLGYGDNEQQSIPSGSTLIFVIDILKIEDYATSAPRHPGRGAAVQPGARAAGHGQRAHQGRDPLHGAGIPPALQPHRRQLEPRAPVRARQGRHPRARRAAGDARGARPGGQQPEPPLPHPEGQLRPARRRPVLQGGDRPARPRSGGLAGGVDLGGVAARAGEAALARCDRRRTGPRPTCPRVRMRDEAFEPLSAAIDKHQEVRFDYLKPFEESASERIVQPLALFSHEGRWHLYSLDPEHGWNKTFLLRRIVNDVTTTGKTFDPPAGDQAAIGLAELEEVWNERVVVVEVEPGSDAEARLSKRRGAARRKDGSLELHTADFFILADELAGFGPEVEVISPTRLRDAVHTRLERIAADHG